MLESLPLAPPDAILGLMEAFKRDPNPNKINLSVGVYKDEAGNTPILQCVKEAEFQGWTYAWHPGACTKDDKAPVLETVPRPGTQP